MSGTGDEAVPFSLLQGLVDSTELNERFGCFSLCYDGSFIHLLRLALELLTGNPKGNHASRQRKCMILESVEL